ncbi:MAG: B-box zinc finger protein [Myxococcota bacterium]
MTHCELHPDREAVGACADCGRFICRECDRGPGKLTCPTCAARGHGRRRTPEAQQVAPVQVLVGQHQPPATAPQHTRESIRRASGLPTPGGVQRPTTGQRWAWVPAAGFIWSLALFGARGLWWIAAIPLLLLSLYGARWLWQRHRSERFEQKALRVFRNLRGEAVTKQDVVREHGLDPDDADDVLQWLVAHELLEVDWTDLERPLIYRRGSA